MGSSPAATPPKIHLAESVTSQPKVHELDKHMPPKHEIAIYIDALKGLQKESIVEGQEEVRREAIAICLLVFQEWKKRCTCPRTRRPSKKAKTDADPRSERLCQACKRLSKAWQVYIQLEKLSIVRAQQGARIIEAHQKRNSSSPDEHEAIGVFAEFHQAKIAKLPETLPALGDGIDDHDADDNAE